MIKLEPFEVLINDVELNACWLYTVPAYLSGEVKVLLIANTSPYESY
jgi:hypothetical protein